MKRLFDLVVGVVGMLALSPLMGVLALVLRVRHGRPVLFLQERVGRHGQPFRLVKFRTMNAGPGLNVTTSRDARVHGTGAFLRRTKLDELPQLYNVVVGHMSLVGPRPEVPAYVRLWPTAARDRILSVRPGITDPAAIAFRNESDILTGADDPHQFYIDSVLPAKVAMYLDYIENRSLLSDAKVLVATVLALVKRGELKQYV